MRVRRGREEGGGAGRKRQRHPSRHTGSWEGSAGDWQHLGAPPYEARPGKAWGGLNGASQVLKQAIGIPIPAKSWAPGGPQTQLRGREGRKGQHSWQETHDRPRGENGKKKKKNTQRGPGRKTARWHHFSLIRQRLRGGPWGLKAETPGSERKGGSGAKVEKNKPPGTLIETLPPEWGVKEAGQGGCGNPSGVGGGRGRGGCCPSDCLLSVKRGQETWEGQGR